MNNSKEKGLTKLVYLCWTVIMKCSLTVVILVSRTSDVDTITQYSSINCTDIWCIYYSVQQRKDIYLLSAFSILGGAGRMSKRAQQASLSLELCAVTAISDHSAAGEFGTMKGQLTSVRSYSESCRSSCWISSSISCWYDNNLVSQSQV